MIIVQWLFKTQIEYLDKLIKLFEKSEGKDLAEIVKVMWSILDDYSCKLESKELERADEIEEQVRNQASAEVDEEISDMDDDEKEDIIDEYGSLDDYKDQQVEERYYDYVSSNNEYYPEYLQRMIDSAVFYDATSLAELEEMLNEVKEKKKKIESEANQYLD